MKSIIKPHELGFSPFFTLLFHKRSFFFLSMIERTNCMVEQKCFAENSTLYDIICFPRNFQTFDKYISEKTVNGSRNKSFDGTIFIIICTMFVCIQTIVTLIGKSLVDFAVFIWLALKSFSQTKRGEK